MYSHFDFPALMLKKAVADFFQQEAGAYDCHMLYAHLLELFFNFALFTPKGFPRQQEAYLED